MFPISRDIRKLSDFCDMKQMYGPKVFNMVKKTTYNPCLDNFKVLPLDVWNKHGGHQGRPHEEGHHVDQLCGGRLFG